MVLGFGCGCFVVTWGWWGLFGWLVVVVFVDFSFVVGWVLFAFGFWVVLGLVLFNGLCNLVVTLGFLVVGGVV